MWLVFALGSAIFAGVTAILAKVGLQNVNSNLATALRTIVVVVFAWLVVFIAGTENTITSISAQSAVFLALSGLATGASWLCYFRALQLGDVNKVAPVDKSSTILTMLLAFAFLGEPLTLPIAFGMALMGIGTWLMVKPPKTAIATPGNKWLAYAILSAVFASLTAILSKVGVQGVEPNLATAIRTTVVLAMAWLIVLPQGLAKDIATVSRKSWLFLLFSGVATGLSWLCYFHALQLGPVSLVTPVDKLSIVITVIFSAVFLKEKISARPILGLVLIVVGTLLLLV